MTITMAKRQWRLVLAGYVVLSLCWLVGMVFTWDLAQKNRNTLKGVERNQQRIQRVTATGAGLICAVAEGNEGSDERVMVAYAAGRPLPDLDPICRKVSARALKAVGVTTP